MDYRQLGSVRISPDGQKAVFIVSRSDLKANRVGTRLWIVDLKSGHASPLTKEGGQVSAPAWSSDGKRIAFLGSRGGPRLVWSVSPDGGKPRLEVPVRGLNIMSFEWLPNDAGFIFLAQRRPPAAAQGSGGPRRAMRRGGGKKGPGKGRRAGGGVPKKPVVVSARPQPARLYRYERGAKGAKPLTPDDYFISAFDLASDGRHVVFSSRSEPGPQYSSDTSLHVLDLKARQVRTLITQRTPFGSPRFSPDGKKIAFLSLLDPGDGSYDVRGNRYLQVINADGSGRRILTRSIDNSVGGFTWTDRSDALFLWVGEGVSTKVYRMSLATAEPELLKAFEEPWVLGLGGGVSFSGDGRIGVAALSNAHTPGEVYAIEESGRRLRRLTGFNQDFAALAPRTDVIRYKSDDGLPIEAMVIKPRDYKPGRRYPLLVIIHGGPTFHYQFSFMPTPRVYPIFAFADQGYVIMLPNFRGSTGYGEAFTKANFRDLGGGDFRDILAGVDLLIEQGVADPERLGLMGWSYGGFMAYWTVTHTTRFKAISAGAGLTDLVSHFGTSVARGYGLHESIWQTTPWKNPKLYYDHSPLMFIKNARTPLLIQHDQGDPNVPVTQAHEFYAAARRVGLPVKFVIYPDPGHVPQSPASVLDAMKGNLEWFNKWLNAK